MAPIAYIAPPFVLGLMLWVAMTMQRFYRAYHHDGDFTGRRYDCWLQWSHAESTTPCLAGADAAALYLLRHDSARRTLKHGLRIPWNDLDWRPGRIFFKKVMLFRVPSRKVSFHLPRDIGENLLADAGRGPRPG